jgi:eukaryotic-like serine/threonine-protein kinase
MAGELPSDRDRDSNPSDSRSRSDDTFNDLLQAAVSPPDTLDPTIQPDHFTRLPAGAKISGRFVIEWCVGTGGMGDVYRCQDLETKAPAALKVIRRIDDHSRFRREASILAALSHEAIVRYLAHGTTDTGTPYLAMEWLEGEDLAKVLNRCALSIPDSLTLARRVCEGLSLAHRHGFVHRDIKPSNLFVCRGRFAQTKVLDFGVAHRGVTTHTATRAGTMLGTVGYMAPEQAWGMPSPDPRDDLFSLGCVLFECLTGRPAFAGENSVVVLEAVLQLEPPDVRTLSPHVPEELASLVRDLLRKSRKERPSDADSVMRALEKIIIANASRGAFQSHVRLAPPAFATFVVAHGPDVPEAWDALAHRAGAAPATELPDARVFAWRTASDLALADVVERAVQFASELRASQPELTVHVSAPTDNIVGVELAELASRAAEHAKSELPQAGAVSIAPATHALYRSRFESGAPPGAPFVGRDAELAVLNAMFRECTNDEVATATLVTAPTGAGKSRLLAEFLARTGAERVCVLRARANHTEHDVPSSVLRQLLSTSKGGTIVADFAATVERALSEGTLVLCVDDAQYADLESLRVLAATLTERAERPLLLVGAARSGMTPDRLSIWHAMGAHDLQLRPLSVRSAERYAHAVFPHTREPRGAGDRQSAGTVAQASVPDASDTLPRQIALAEGNPRLLHMLVAAGGDQASPAFDAAVALFAERLVSLPQAELATLCAASQFVDRFRISGVRAVVDSDSDVARDVTALWERKLLVECPVPKIVAETEFTFAHPIVREAACRCTTAAERARMRERATQWLNRAKFDTHGTHPRD